MSFAFIYQAAIITAEERPTISVKINGVRPLPGDALSSTPKIEVTINTVNAPASGRIAVYDTLTNLTLVRVDANYFATHEVTSPLPDGTYVITIEAFDSAGKGATLEVVPLYVQSAKDIAAQGTPLNYPNPFDPGSSTTTLSYTLSRSASITLTIHDLSGTLLAKKQYGAGDNGGKAGYNTVTWDGKSDTGAVVGNGIYPYLIIADGRVIARGKIMVLKR